MKRLLLLAPVVLALTGCGLPKVDTPSWGAFIGHLGTVNTPNAFQTNQGPPAIAPLGGGAPPQGVMLPGVAAPILVRPREVVVPEPIPAGSISSPRECTLQDCCDRIDAIERSLGKLIHTQEIKRMPRAE